MDANIVVLFASLAAIATAGFVANNWIRVKSGHAPSDDWTGLADLVGRKGNDPEKDRLVAENRELNDKLDSMQDRMIVLEKIVTDRGYSLSDEIEALRDIAGSTSDNGVALNLSKKEQA